MDKGGLSSHLWDCRISQAAMIYLARLYHDAIECCICWRGSQHISLFDSTRLCSAKLVQHRTMTCTSSKVPRSNLTSCILWKSAALQSFMASTILAHRAAPCCGDFQKGNAVSVIAEPIDVTF